ncbi:unnamed protein product [Aureobasidium pullulans]|nr:unnamed protein product [Aureobasidium pullulans]
MSDLAGGFVPLSPPPSSIASSNTPNSLPQPRRTPLKPGGTKESRLIRHVDQQLLHIQRRFAKRDPSLGHEGVREMDEEGRMIEQLNDPATEKRLQQSEEWNDVQGYAGFAEAARDVEELIGVIWVSGTPALQLDHAFASLLVGRDVSTDEILPGFNAGRGVSGTEKVRIKSLVERTRICVVEVVNRGEFDEDDDLDEPSPEDTDMDGDLILDEDDGPQYINVDDTEDDDWNMQVARVYDKTLVELGDSMDGPPIDLKNGNYEMNYELMQPLQPANFQARMLDQETLLLKASPNGPRLYYNFRTRAMYKTTTSQKQESWEYGDVDILLEVNEDKTMIQEMVFS